MESNNQNNEINTLVSKMNNEENNMIDPKNENINELSSLKKKIFNVDEIIEKCKEKDVIELLNFMCSVMHEKKRNILEMLYKELGKHYLIITLEKALDIENNGGLEKGKCIYAKKTGDKKSNENNPVINNLNEKKSTGGIFFGLIKKDPNAKSIINKATRLDYKESQKRKKVYKLMDKLNI